MSESICFLDSTTTRRQNDPRSWVGALTSSMSSWKQSHVLSGFVFFPLHVSRYTKQKAGPKQSIWLVHLVSPAHGLEGCSLKGPAQYFFSTNNNTEWAQHLVHFKPETLCIFLHFNKWLRPKDQNDKWLIGQLRSCQSTVVQYNKKHSSN